LELKEIAAISIAIKRMIIGFWDKNKRLMRSLQKVKIKMNVIE